MKFTLEDKIDLAFGAPLGGCTFYSAPISEAKSKPDPADQLGLDKRLRITKSWVNYSRNVDYIEQMRDAAMAAGLDREFKSIVSGAMTNRDISGVSVDDPMTYSEAQGIYIALVDAKFETHVAERIRELNSKIEEPTDPRLIAAVDVLRAEDTKKAWPKQSLTLMQLLNPKRIAADEPIIVWYYDDDKLKSTKIDNNRPPKESMDDIISIIERRHYVDLASRLRKVIAAMTAVLEAYWPSLNPSQMKYTAWVHAMRSVADDISDIEKTRHKEDAAKDAQDAKAAKAAAKTAAAAPAAPAAPAPAAQGGMIEFECDNCRASIKAPPQFAGRKGRCKNCGKTIEVPYLPTPTPTP